MAGPEADALDFEQEEDDLMDKDGGLDVDASSQAPPLKLKSDIIGESTPRKTKGRKFKKDADAGCNSHLSGQEFDSLNSNGGRGALRCIHNVRVYRGVWAIMTPSSMMISRLGTISSGRSSTMLSSISSCISNEGRLPRKYTEEGQGSLKNISPPLEWYNVPHGTKSLALLVQDIDAPTAPNRPWVCWLLINIPPHLNTIPDGFSGNKQIPPEYEGITEGLNDLKVPGWRGLKLPDHGHRLEFKLYALDHDLHLGHKVTKDKVMEAIEGHVLGEAVLIAMH